MTKVYLLLLILFFHFSLFAQFRIDAEIRPRFEFRDGYRVLSNPDDKAVILVDQRTRLNFSYVDKTGIESYISLQDTRVWGEYHTNTHEPTSYLYQGWIKLPIGERLAIKMGRQEIEYDDVRIISKNDWRLQGRSHDAALLDYRSRDSTWTVQLTGAINHEREVLFRDRYAVDNYKNLQMLWVNKKYNKGEVSLLYLDNGYQLVDTSVNHTKTMGLYTQRFVGPVTFSGSYYVQLGKNILDERVQASMLSMTASVKVNQKLRIAPGFDRLSGTSAAHLLDPAYNKTNAFIPLYTRRHRYFGEQDMFYAGGNDIVPGLTDIFVKFNYTFSSSLSGKLDFHHFSTAEDFLDVSSNIVSDKFLGMEVDAAVNYRYSSNMNITFAYTRFLATESLELLQQRGDRHEAAHYAYIRVTYRPVFFDSGR